MEAIVFFLIVMDQSSITRIKVEEILMKTTKNSSQAAYLTHWALRVPHIHEKVM